MLQLEQTCPQNWALPSAQRAHQGQDLGVRRLSFSANNRQLINIAELRLSANGVSVIMGPNGAGKSLFLRLIHGLIAPTSGLITWGGHALDEACRQRQSMVFQRPVLLRRSVAANLDFVLPKAKTERNAWLDRIGLRDQAHQPARQLSGGEQQRLAMARALATHPDILLLDEPTASLDPASAMMIEGLIATAAGNGTKIVLVTHGIDQAKRLADDVVFMSTGRVTEQADVHSFFAIPQSAEANAYLNGELRP